MTANEKEALLCVVHYPSNTGFAWNYFEGMYAEIAEQLTGEGISTYVSYPVIEKPPRLLQGTAAVPILLDATLDSPRSIRETVKAVRRLNIRTVYFTDRGWTHWALPFLRLAGVRRVVAHDHTSGGRTPPRGLKYLLKWVRARIPWINADLTIGVSEYIARRHREVNLSPDSRIARLWYGITLPELTRVEGEPPIPELATDRPIVLCVCRAAPEKGVDVLVRAFDQVIRSWDGAEPKPMLVFVGAGPELENLRALAASLPSAGDIAMPGYRDDVPRFIERATVSVVPSVWQDACPLGVLEPMSFAKPVIASDVGGVPDEINSPEVGQRVPPGDDAALAAALMAMLRDPDRRQRVGTAARERIRQHFNRRPQINALVRLIVGR